MKFCFRPQVSGLLLALVLLAFPAWAKRQIVDRTLITVNDEIILQSDLDGFREKAKSKNFQELFGGLDPKKLNDTNTLTQLLVEEKILDQQVKKLELTASDVEIDRHIRTILERNGITLAQLKSRLKDLGTNFTDYRAGIKRQLERHNLVEREIKPSTEVSEEDLKLYLSRHGGSDLGHRYELAHILVTTKGKAGQERAEKILQEALSNPAGFDALAKEYSDDSATSRSGGDLGMLTQESMVTEFRPAAKQTEAGKVFPKLVKTAGGWHIIKVLKSQPMSFSDLPEDKKMLIRNQMAGEELEKKMTSWMEKKKSEAHIRRSDNMEKDAKSGI